MRLNEIDFSYEGNWERATVRGIRISRATGSNCYTSTRDGRRPYQKGQYGIFVDYPEYRAWRRLDPIAAQAILLELLNDGNDYETSNP